MTLIAAIQMCTGDAIAANLDAAARLLADAARQGARVAVLPENFAFMGAHEADKLAHAEDEGRGPIQEFLARIAARLGLWVVGGTVPLRVADDAARVHAACLVYDDRGRPAGRYDKMHLFDVDVAESAARQGSAGGGSGAERYRESATIRPGADRCVVVQTPAGCLGLSVCYDLRFPELYRRLVRAGAQILAVPSAFTRRTGEAHWDVLLRARAIENQCYVVAPGQAGRHPGGRETWGNSIIVDPWGQILARRADGEGALVAELSQERLAALRQSFPVLDHRRIEP